MFEIRAKDGLGRIGRLEIHGKVVETPALMPVINPKKAEIAPREMQEKFKAQMIITNAYIIYESSLREEAASRGIHELLDFDGVIATDSGSFQLMNYGNITVTNQEIVEFQQAIKSDISTFLDIPTTPNCTYEKALTDLEVTLERAREAQTLKKGFMNGTVQGGRFLDLRERACKELAAMDFEIHPLGAVVPFLLKYSFTPLLDIILTCKKHLPVERPVHLFGAGHPLLLPLAVLCGCDLFDSAAYILYAKGNRYLTPSGTRNLEDLLYFPCECPECSRTDPETVSGLSSQEKIAFLTRHNLYSTFGELRRIKQAIHEGSLWELVESRIRSHPNLLESYHVIKKYSDFIETSEPFTKRSGFFYTGAETKFRPVVARSASRIAPIPGETFEHPVFGKVPVSLSQTYPFHTDEVVCMAEKNMIRDITVYQFGVEAASLFEKAKVSYGRTGKVRHLHEDGCLLATLRPMDGLFVLTLEGARKLHSLVTAPRRRVVADEEAVPFVKDGKDLFSRFVLTMDEALRAYEEVLITDGDDILLGVGRLVLSPKEVQAFKRGVAVYCRRGADAIRDP
ncbi:MAG: tRNA guanosine(15) transglycosylase TgtA [Theionarchaea archaeon]|nr:tRNA guanosine(15) transglycosylase TgtA [Theionarchaea archaeon]MBU6999641.1 tRNA guanosine(15) transglycosylase TgtA [Theionarchaea archaeon]MBU7020647.1 tRNA guanosine(15) transglycosylase TgtA [Theionarchaea archaeon]MBU7035025.1 tRNA guanosine(15) transglycosylase TgtA [Theionarchaea archaeon]MBU7039821.1 tRNA guanosine(15) transglycosylase TgtA [Theionarchaea archaeon]